MMLYFVCGTFWFVENVEDMKFGDVGVRGLNLSGVVAKVRFKAMNIIEIMQ